MKKEFSSVITVKTLLAVVIFAGVGIIIIGGGYIIGEYSKTQNNKDAIEESLNEWRICNQDSDCVETKADCCNCGHGGEQIGINKKYLKNWEDVLRGKCQDIGCIALFSCKEGSVVCENNKCGFKEEISDNDQINISNWQTYRNEEFGFEMEYPNEIIEEEDAVFFTGLIDKDTVVVKILVKRNKSSDDLVSDIEKDIIVQEAGAITSDEMVSFGNTLSRKIVYSLPTGTDRTIYYIERNQDTIEIIWGYYERENIKNIEKILSSFKFIEEDETADWKVYQNEEFGFEVKYPEDFTKQETVSDNSLLYLKRAENGSNIFMNINIKRNYQVNYFEAEEIKIGDRIGYKYFYQEGVGYSGVVLIQLDQDALELTYDFIGYYKNKKISKESFVENNLDQILSTFKFIE